MTAAEAKGGQYTYYVCQSKIKKGSETCETPRLNARNFERTIIEQLRSHILTESNICEHKLRKERLEAAAEEARRTLAEIRRLLHSTEAIATFAADMAEFLLTSELTETRALLQTFFKRIAVKPGRATIRYTIPMPEDSPIGRKVATEVALTEGVRSSVRVGGPDETELRTFAREINLRMNPWQLRAGSPLWSDWRWKRRPHHRTPRECRLRPRRITPASFR